MAATASSPMPGRTIDADAAVRLIRPGMTVFVQGSIGQPLSLMRALADAGGALRGVHFVSPLTPGVNGFPIGSEAEGCRFTSFFDYRELRRSFRAGGIAFVPSHYSDIAARIAQAGVDVALIQLSPPDAAGLCGTGLCADFVPDILDRCWLVIAEINAAMPAIANGPKVPLDRLDHVVAADYPLPAFEPPAPDPTAERIARNAAALVRDGDCIQFGVGRIPQQVVGALGDRNDLGLHGGLVTPVVRPLIESGAINGRRKTIDRAMHVTGAAIGDQCFYDWIAGHAAWAFRPVSHTHDIAVLGSLDGLVAINSAIEVDLFGQANAETAGGRQVSGSGGLVDFVRGARRSHGGRALICLPSTSPDGQRSSIVPRLSGPTTLCRTDMHYVVTEHGVADLSHGSVEARARALIDIAAPQFRDALEAEGRAMR
ncbi:acetyl-CoA hydrolase [Rhizorhabdus wittichii DC-6]|nr:acetyl-CoA hydrolase [Rhizorhabdus wittichii DC-6]